MRLLDKDFGYDWNHKSTSNFYANWPNCRYKVKISTEATNLFMNTIKFPKDLTLESRDIKDFIDDIDWSYLGIMAYRWCERCN